MSRPHGSRARYVFGPAGSDSANGCRCLPCTDANRDYQRARARGAIDGMVDTAETRAHIEWLQAQGIGLRSIAAASGVNRSSLQQIVAGRARIHARTASRILAVHRGRAAADAQRIPTAPSRRLIDELVAAGHTRSDLARRLGYKGRGIQCINSDLISRRNADRIAALHAELIRWDPDWQRRDEARRRKAEQRNRSRDRDRDAA